MAKKTTEKISPENVTSFFDHSKSFGLQNVWKLEENIENLWSRAHVSSGHFMSSIGREWLRNAKKKKENARPKRA